MRPNTPMTQPMSSPSGSRGIPMLGMPNGDDGSLGSDRNPPGNWRVMKEVSPGTQTNVSGNRKDLPSSSRASNVIGSPASERLGGCDIDRMNALPLVLAPARVSLGARGMSINALMRVRSGAGRPPMMTLP